MGVPQSVMDKYAKPIAGYDIVLAVQESGLQKQLQELYEIQAGDVLPPIPSDDGSDSTAASEAPVAQYLIDHYLKIVAHTANSDPKGLRAHIDCPVVLLSSGNSRQVKIEISFSKSPCKQHPTASNSTVTYRESDSGPPKTESVNGWKISWIAGIDQRTISNIMDELVNPSKSNKSNVVLPPAALAQIEALPVKSRDFMMSSAFCVFELATVATSFNVVDQSGNRPPDPLFNAMKDLVKAHAQNLTAAAAEKHQAGLPTPQNPFILGYGIIQTPQRAEVTVQESKIPRFLVPREMHMTVSSQQDKAPASLNYCMLTYRDPPWEPRHLDPNGGVIQPSLCAKVPWSDQYTGVMALSQELMFNLILLKIAPALFIQIPDSPLASFTSLDLDSDHVDRSGPNFNVVSPTLYQLDRRYQQTMVRKSKIGFVTTEREDVSATIDSKVMISLESDLSRARASNSTMKEDAKHFVYIVAISTMDYAISERVKVTLGSGESNNIKVSLKYRVEIELSTGANGTWVAKRTQNCIFPEIADGKLKLTQEDPNGRFGSYVTGGSWISSSPQDSGGGGGQGFVMIGTSLQPQVEKLNMQAVDNLVDEHVKHLADNLGAAVVMPAGDVYMFSGLDSDSDGQMYARVTYRNRTEGIHI